MSSDNVFVAKRCSKCCALKPATAEFFTRDRARPDGWLRFCKVCLRAEVTRRKETGLLPQKTERERFDEYAGSGSPDECWVWRGGLSQAGYGKFWRNGRTDLAHRVMYEYTLGAVPDDMWVLHRCDNPPCMNPRHLFLGTHADNENDKDAKGRRKRGSQTRKSKLDEARVTQIREMHAAGVQQKTIAREFGVDITTVNDVVHRHTWRHVG